MGKIVYGRCLACDKDFTYEKSDKGGKPRVYCSKECSYRGNKLLAKVKSKDRLGDKYRRKHTLDDTIKEMRKNGMSDADYSALQRQKTLEMVGGVRL